MKKATDLAGVVHLAGVRQLKDHVAGNVIAATEALARHHGSKTEAEVRALCATLAANLDLYQLITGVKKKKKAIEQALREVNGDTENNPGASLPDEVFS